MSNRPPKTVPGDAVLTSGKTMDEIMKEVLNPDLPDPFEGATSPDLNLPDPFEGVNPSPHP